MAEQPKVASEPWSIINAFAEALNRRANMDVQAAQQLERVPIEERSAERRARMAKELGLEFLPQELDIQDRFQARRDERGFGYDMRRLDRSSELQRGNTEHSIRLQGDENRRSQANASQLGFNTWLQQRDRLNEDEVNKETRTEERDNRQSAREESEYRARKEFDEPFDERSTNRTLEKQSKLQEERDRAILERQERSILLRAEQQRKTKEHEWYVKEGYYKRNPWLARSQSRGSGKIGVDGIIFLDPSDTIAIDEAHRSSDFEGLGLQPDPNNPSKSLYAFRDRRPRPPEFMAPDPSLQGVPAQGTGQGTAPAQTAPQGTTGAQPQAAPQGPVTTNKSGDRISREPTIQKQSYNQDEDNSPDINDVSWLRGYDDAPPQLQAIFERVGERYNLSPDLLAAQSYQESKWRTNARSHAGAQGISQFMPGTAERFNVNVRDPVSSIAGQAKYMNVLLNKFDGNLGLALAGYNWGEGGPRTRRGVHAWLQSGADPRRMPRETRGYVQAITGKPIEYWVSQYRNGGQEDRGGTTTVAKSDRPTVQKTSRRNEDGDELFYVDI